MASTAAANQAIFDRLSGMSQFHPATANLFADWTLDPGDVVTVRQGQTDYTVPIYQMNLDWRGKPMVEVQSTGSEKRPPLSALKRNSYGSGKRQEEQEQELIRHRADIEKSNERILLWATEEEWSEIAEEYQTTHNSQFEVNATGISSVVTGIDAGTFKASNAYAVGDVTVHNGKVYVFRTAHAANTPWDPTEVQEALNLYGSVKSHSTRIQQTESKIALVVDDNGIRRGQILLAINGDGGNQAVIEADAIDINGIVTRLVGADVSFGDCTVTGTLTARLTGDVEGDLDGDVIGEGHSGYFENGIYAGTAFRQLQVANAEDVNGTLRITKVDGTVLTFSRATAPTIGGSWNGGVYSITSNPAAAAGSVMSARLSSGIAQTITRGTGSNSNIYTISWDIGYDTQVQGEWRRYGSTGRTGSFTLDASDVYSDGQQDIIALMDITASSVNSFGEVSGATVPVKIDIEIGDPSQPDFPFLTDSTTVNVDLSSLLEARTGTDEITSNGDYAPSTGKLGFSTVKVNVSQTPGSITGITYQRIMSVPSTPPANYTHLTAMTSAVSSAHGGTYGGYVMFTVNPGGTKYYITIP